MRGFRQSVIVLGFVSICAAAAVSQTAWTPEMQVKTRAVGGPRVSPDGKRVVYTINDAVMTADKSEFVTQIWMATADGKENYQVTFGDKSSTNPKWSPDGNSIAFTSNRKDNKNNLYVLRLMGAEAEPITDVKSSVGDFNWSPDGKWIAYSSADPKSEDEEKNDKGKNDFRWIDENIKMSRLHVVSVAKDGSGKREPRKLTNDNRHVTGFDWSPDGSRIVFNHVSTPSANDWPSSDIAVVEVATAKVTPLATTASAESALHYSPDGKWISGIASDVPARWAQSYTVRVYPAAGGQPRVFAGSHDSQPTVIGWTPDGTKIMFYEAKGTGTALYEVDVAAGTIREVDFQNAVISAVNLSRVGSSYAIAFVQQTASSPPEAYAGVMGNSGGLTRVSNANADAAKMPVGKTELVKWKSKDGREIEGLLTYPIGYSAGTKVPLILNIHGGPAGVFQQSFIGGRGSYPLATFASKGYAILRPNPRGSSGYGTEFRRANIKDWGGMDYEDLMTRCRPCHRDGRCRPEPARRDGLELRRLHDLDDHHKDEAVQGGIVRRAGYESDEL